MRFRQNHATYSRLLTSIVLLMATAPFLSNVPYGSQITSLIFAVVILSAVWEFATTPRLFVIGIVLGFPALGARILGVVIGDRFMVVSAIIEGTTILVLSYAVYEIVSDIVTTEKVTADTLRGAISAYLLLGIGWASAYGLVEFLQPGSFNMATATTIDQSPNLLYYSFVVLTTLGFGDITPLTAASRGLTWIEAVTGQLFIAMTIARLVGLKLYGETR